MSTRAALRVSMGEIGLIGAAAAVPVVIAIALAGDKRAVAPPAVAIGLVVVIAEVLVEHLRRENRELGQELEAARAVTRDTAADGQWADSPAVTEPIPMTSDERTERRPVPIAQFLARDRRHDDAQCPRCGRFDVDVDADDGKRSSYTCRACGNVWSWARGTPWPDVTVVADPTRIERN